jgi:hypothetical protein
MIFDGQIDRVKLHIIIDGNQMIVINGDEYEQLQPHEHGKLNQ